MIVTELCREILIQTGYIKLRNIDSKLQSNTGVLSIVLAHIESHLFEDLRLAALAKTAGVSLSSLQKNFRKEVGYSPAEFIRKRRLEEAKLALERGKKTVYEVSELVGYKDSTAFTRAFSRQFRISPFKVKPTKK